MGAFLLSLTSETEANVKRTWPRLHALVARWLNTKGRWQEHPRSYSVVAHHEGLSFLRPGFKSRYEHLSIDYSTLVVFDLLLKLQCVILSVKRNKR